MPKRGLSFKLLIPIPLFIVLASSITLAVSSEYSLIDVLTGKVTFIDWITGRQTDACASLNCAAQGKICVNGQCKIDCSTYVSSFYNYKCSTSTLITPWNAITNPDAVVACQTGTCYWCQKRNNGIEICGNNIDEDCNGQDLACAATACTPGTCPAPSTVVCGLPIPAPNQCTTCTGTGTQCALGQTCQSGVCVTPTYTCTGTTPSNARLCSGDDTSLTVDTSKLLVSSCTTTRMCEYTCNQGYTLSNGVCIAQQPALTTNGCADGSDDSIFKPNQVVQCSSSSPILGSQAPSLCSNTWHLCNPSELASKGVTDFSQATGRIWLAGQHVSCDSRTVGQDAQWAIWAGVGTNRCGINSLDYINPATFTASGAFCCSGQVSTAPTCTPIWQCTPWSTCSQQSIQTRTCTDSNNCGVLTGKPAEQQSCTPATTCTNECSQGQRQKVSNTQYKICSNYDLDSCLEWSSTLQCPTDQQTDINGNCIPITSSIEPYTLTIKFDPSADLSESQRITSAPTISIHSTIPGTNDIWITGDGGFFYKNPSNNRVAYVKTIIGTETIGAIGDMLLSITKETSNIKVHISSQDQREKITATFSVNAAQEVYALGTRALSEEPSELMHEVQGTSSAIGSRNTDFNTNFGVIVKNSGFYGSRDEALLEITDAQPQPPLETQARCGNSIKEEGEECDGNDLGYSTCSLLGFYGGSVSCNPDCIINTAACQTICTEAWACEEFTPEVCPSSGQRTRTCTDLNNCGTTNNRPELTQSCIPNVGTCTTIINNGPSEDKLDVVFLGYVYTTEELSTFTSDVRRHIDYMLTITPFKEKQNKINFHQVNLLDNSICSNEDSRGGISCRMDRVHLLASQCPNDIPIVIPNRPGRSIGISFRSISSSGWSSVLVLTPKNYPDVTVHEFAHALGNLGDEYNPLSTWDPLEQPSSQFILSFLSFPNCDDGTCTKWCSEVRPVEFYKNIECTGTTFNECKLAGQRSASPVSLESYTEGSKVCQWIGTPELPYYREWLSAYNNLHQNTCINAVEFCSQFQTENECEGVGIIRPSYTFCRWRSTPDPYFGSNCIISLMGEGIDIGIDCQEGTGCFPGCGTYGNLFRSTPTSIMRHSSLYTTFGPINERILNERLDQYS